MQAQIGKQSELVTSHTAKSRATTAPVPAIAIPTAPRQPPLDELQTGFKRA